MFAHEKEQVILFKSRLITRRSRTLQMYANNFFFSPSYLYSLLIGYTTQRISFFLFQFCWTIKKRITCICFINIQKNSLSLIFFVFPHHLASTHYLYNQDQNKTKKTTTETQLKLIYLLKCSSIVWRACVHQFIFVLLLPTTMK